jgi:hypothetical protein
MCSGDFAILEDGAVELGSFFSLAVEPEAGSDLSCHCCKIYDEDCRVGFFRRSRE